MVVMLFIVVFGVFTVIILFNIYKMKEKKAGQYIWANLANNNEKSEIANPLLDLDGNPFRFFRGNAAKTGFWSNSIQVAKKAAPNCVWTATIVAKKLIVFDVNLSSYGHMTMENTIISPSKAINDFLSEESIQVAGYFGTDDILNFLSKSEYDVAVIKNVKEGWYPDFPVYDVIVLDDKCLINCEKVINDKTEDYIRYSVKRIDLSSYLNEYEEDGYAMIIKKDRYEIRWVLDPYRMNYKRFLSIYGINKDSYVRIMYKGLVYKVTKYKASYIIIDRASFMDEWFYVGERVDIELPNCWDAFSNNICVEFREDCSETSLTDGK